MPREKHTDLVGRFQPLAAVTFVIAQTCVTKESVSVFASLDKVKGTMYYLALTVKHALPRLLIQVALVADSYAVATVAQDYRTRQFRDQCCPEPLWTLTCQTKCNEHVPNTAKSYRFFEQGPKQRRGSPGEPRASSICGVVYLAGTQVIW